MARVITIGQAGGGTRYLAVTYHNERPEMIDHLPSLACLDVGADRARTWETPIGCRDTEAGRVAIQAHLDDLTGGYDVDGLDEGPYW